MTDDIILITTGSGGGIGKILDAESLTVGANTVLRERMLVTGTGSGQKQEVLGYSPGGAENAGVVRPIPGNIAYPVSGSGTTNPVRIDPVGTTTQPVSGTVTANQGTAGSAWPVSQSGGWTVTASVSGSSGAPVAVTGSSSVTNPVRIDPVGTTTQPVSGTVTSNAGTGTFNVFGGVSISGSGGAPVAVTGSSSTTNPVRIDPVGTTTQPVSGTITANAGTGTFNIFGGISVSGSAGVPVAISGSSAANTQAVAITGSIVNTVTVSQTGAWTFSGGVTGSIAVTGSNLGPAVIITGSTNSPWVQVQGEVASGVADANNPIKFGAVATTAQGGQAAVATGQRVNISSDKFGRIIDTPYANPESYTGSGEITLTAAQPTWVEILSSTGSGWPANSNLYITSLTASNTSASTTRVIFSGSNSRNEMSFFLAASGGGVTHTMPAPLRVGRGFSGSMTSAVTDVRVSAQGYIAP